MAHNIISGSVSNRREHVPARVTARKVAKRSLIIVAALFAAMLALGFTLNATGHGPAESIPACELEDGSTQETCIWYDSDGWQYINHSFGEWYEVHPR
jgi:hypothetical protein